MENAHIVKSFDEDLARIESLILEMGGLVETQINESAKAMVHRDLELAKKVLSDDKTVDQLEARIDEMTLRTLALRQPMAADLRHVISALKIAANLERIGDYSKNIAKRTSVLVDSAPVGSSEKTLKRMAAMVEKMVADVLNAYSEKDMAMAEEIRVRDEEVDHMHNTLFRELLTYMMENPRNITPCMHMLFIAKNLERMGDHSTAIAEQVHYIVTGVVPDEKRAKSDVTSRISVESVSK